MIEIMWMFKERKYNLNRYFEYVAYLVFCIWHLWTRRKQIEQMKKQYIISNEMEDMLQIGFFHLVPKGSSVRM